MQNAKPDTNLMTAAEFKVFLDEQWDDPTPAEQRDLRERQGREEIHGGIPLTPRQYYSLEALRIMAHQMGGKAAHEPPADWGYLPGPYYMTTRYNDALRTVEVLVGKATFKAHIFRDGHITASAR